MKFTLLALLCLCLITISIAVNVLKVTKKVKKSKKAKTSADNSWEGGYQCDILVDGNKNGAGYFFANKLATTTSTTASEKLGWVFKMTSQPESNLAKILVSDTSGNHYLPYRLIKTQATYTNPSGDNKYISLSVHLDNGEQHIVKVNLPYKMFGWYINDEQGQIVANFINTYRTNTRNNILEAKSTISKSSSDYITKSPLFQAASKKGSGISIQIEDLKNKQNALEAQIKQTQTSLASTQTAFNNAKSTAAQLSERVGPLSNELLNLDIQHKTAVDELEALKTKSTLANNDVTLYSNNSSQALRDWTTGIANLKILCPSRTATIDVLNAELLKLNREGVNSNMMLIRPLI